MATSTQSLHRIRLGAETDQLYAVGAQFVQSLFGAGPTVEALSLDDLAMAIYADPAPEEMVAVALVADDDGHLPSDSSVLDRVLTSQSPVLVLRGAKDAPVVPEAMTRLVVPLDGSSVAGQAIPVARRVALLTGLPVRFVMVIDPSRVIPASFAYDPDSWGIIEELRTTAHWALGQAEESMRRDGIEVESDLLYGPINGSLLAAVGEGDLVIMTTHGHGGNRATDSVARRVLVSIPQPTLVMRAMRQGDVIVDGYEACAWVEPLNRNLVWKK